MIILSSAGLGITQYFYADMKAKFLDCQANLKAVFERNPTNAQEALRSKYDVLRSVQLGSPSIQVRCLFALLIGLGAIKSLEVTDLLFHPEREWGEFYCTILAIITVAGTIVLAWIAYTFLGIGRSVRKLEEGTQIFGDHSEILGKVTGKT
jgi:hypothetical protein